TRSACSATASARCWGSWPRAVPTRASRRHCTCRCRRWRSTRTRSSTSWGCTPRTGTTGGCWRSCGIWGCDPAVRGSLRGRGRSPDGDFSGGVLRWVDDVDAPQRALDKAPPSGHDLRMDRTFGLGRAASWWQPRRLPACRVVELLDLPGAEDVVQAVEPRPDVVGLEDDDVLDRLPGAAQAACPDDDDHRRRGSGRPACGS